MINEGSAPFLTDRSLVVPNAFCEGSPPFPQDKTNQFVIVYNIPGCDLEEACLSLYLVCMVRRYGEKWVNYDCHWFFETVRNVKPTSPVPQPSTWYIRHKTCIYDDRVKGTFPYHTKSIISIGGNKNGVNSCSRY